MFRIGFFFFFSSRRRHTRCSRDWSSDVCSSDLEGVDERVLEAREVEEVSLGDFVLSGGEPAAIALIDACVRLLPGVVGCAETLAEESFAEGLLEYPHYTRPQVWQERAVPEVLVSGDHQKVRAWRRAQAERLTRERRPDLWRRHIAQQEAERQKDER